MCHTDYLRKAISCNKLIMKGNEGKRRFPERKKLEIPYEIRKEQTFLRKLIFGRWVPGNPAPFKKKT